MSIIQSGFLTTGRYHGAMDKAEADKITAVLAQLGEAMRFLDMLPPFAEQGAAPVRHHLEEARKLLLELKALE